MPMRGVSQERHVVSLRRASQDAHLRLDRLLVLVVLLKFKQPGLSTGAIFLGGGEACLESVVCGTYP